MDYFVLFPKTTINDIEVSDITRRPIIKSNISDLVSKTLVPDNLTSNDISYYLYNTDDYFWIIELLNPNITFDPLLSTEEFLAFISAEYDYWSIKPATLTLTNLEKVVHVTDGEEFVCSYDTSTNVFKSGANRSYSEGLFYAEYDGIRSLINGNIDLQRNQIAKYMINGEWYCGLPVGYYLEDAEETKTYQDCQFEINESKREISYLEAKYIPNLIQEIKRFLK
jgi:hypothetical protein